jgi:hypothetical protein
MRGVHLNGWQRIGIALSVVWLIVGCLYIRHGQLQNAAERSGITYSSCKDAVNDFASSQCIAHAGTIYRMYEGSWDSAALIALIPIPIAWLFTYGLVAFVRWIRAGF